MKVVWTFVVATVAAVSLSATRQTTPQEVSFGTGDGGTVVAHLYGDGGRGVVLAHGAVFNKESWAPLADTLVSEGLLVLSIDFRGYGRSTAGTDPGALYQDVLAGVRYLRENGALEVSVIGASMGGSAAGRAAIEARVGEIDRLMLLAAGPVAAPAALKAGTLLFVTSEGDPVASGVRDQYDRAPEPKRLKILPGDAHAQHILRTAGADTLTRVIVEFLATNP